MANLKVDLDLAQAILKTNNTKLQRSYVIWMSLRNKVTETGRMSYPIDDIVNEFAEKTGRLPLTVKGWINAGGKGGLFLVNDKKGVISIVSRKRVLLKYLGHSYDSKTITISEDLIAVKSAQELRARLYGLFPANKKKWISRETLTELTGKHKKTQLRYDKINKQKKDSTYTINNETGEAIQLPNIYHPSSYYNASGNAKLLTRQIQRGYEQVNDNHLCNSSSPVGIPFERVAVTGKSALVETKLLYDKRDEAIEASNRRAKKGLWPVTFSVARSGKRGPIILEAHATL